MACCFLINEDDTGCTQQQQSFLDGGSILRKKKTGQIYVWSWHTSVKFAVLYNKFTIHSLDCQSQRQTEHMTSVWLFTYQNMCDSIRRTHTLHLKGFPMKKKLLTTKFHDSLLKKAPLLCCAAIKVSVQSPQILPSSLSEFPTLHWPIRCVCNTPPPPPNPQGNWWCLLCLLCIFPVHYSFTGVHPHFHSSYLKLTVH